MTEMEYTVGSRALHEPAGYKEQVEYKELVIIDGVDVQTYWLDTLVKNNSSTIYLGRSAQNDIVINQPFISGSHAIIQMEGPYVSITDNNSTNGLYLCQGGRYAPLLPGQPFTISQNNTIIRVGCDANHFAFLIFSEKDTRSTWNVVPFDKPLLQIGRGEECDICLKNVAVSRKHAAIQNTGNGYEIVDLNSTNGVLVNGQMISGRQALANMDIIHIAGSVLVFTYKQVVFKVPTEGVSLQLEQLTKVVNKNKTILDHVNCCIEPNEFVAIIGGSGAGKSTVMTAMSGFDSKVTGKVYFNDLDLHANFDAIKNIIGFVPQQDIIYENLTLKKMLLYTAKMKMPSDTTKEEMHQRIQKVLEMVELSQHQDTFIRKLSGGQKKRASIAVELLSDPKLFFLDEPTSGLDPGTERNLMHTLQNLSKRQGKTIIMVTHTTQNIHLCDKVIIMGAGGRLCYCGEPGKALDFFGVTSLVDVYDLTTKDSEYWSRKFAESVADKPVAETGEVTRTVVKKRQYSRLSQLKVLMSRYFELIWNDKQRLILLMLQPLLIGLLLMVVAAEDVFEIFEDTKSILFALTCSGIWIGLFNTIQEICKERVILKREYMSNLYLSVYILSKCLVQAVLCLVQTGILLGCFVITVGIPDKGILFDNAFLEMYITLFITIYASAAMGLIVSALSKNADRAMAVSPFLLIIQLLFSGILFELEGASDTLSKFTISRWSIECLGSTSDLNDLTLRIQEELPQYEHEASEMFEFAASHLWANWGIMLVFIVIFAVVSALVLRSLSNEQR